MTSTAGELSISRVFDAPRPLVYRAFVDADQFSAWFGPVGWSVSRGTVRIEGHVGGRQSFTMINDDDPSQASPVDATFTEVIENELLVGSQIVDLPDGPVEFYLRLEFHDQGDGQTRLELRQGPYSPELENGARAGWGSSFTKLDALLAA